VVGESAFAAAGGPFGLDLDGSGFAGGVMVEAAPAVVLGFGHETSGDWIAVDVLNFFGSFSDEWTLKS
jgi:hypothetical protein